MFKRLKSLYRYDYEFSALDSLSDPSNYEGLKPMQVKDLKYQVSLFPSFDPTCTWTVYKDRDGWLVRRVCWHRTSSLSGLGSNTYAADSRIDNLIGDELFECLSKVNVKAFSYPSALGLDGVSYGVKMTEHYYNVELYWWCKAPQGWEELAEWHNKATEVFESLLPEITSLDEDPSTKLR